MLATSARTLVLLSSAVLLGATDTDARRILPKPILDSNHDLEPIAATATAPIYAHTQPPEQRVAHTIVHAHRQAEETTKPLNDPSSVSSLLSRLSTATAASSASSTGSQSQAASATGTGPSSSSSSIPFLSIGSEPTDFGSSSAAAATATATAGGGGNGAAAALSGSVKAGVVLAGALAAYMALGACFLCLGL